jgi:DNA-binding Lrp family transcriptional regulator
LADKIAEEEILHEIENQPRTSIRRLANHLRVSQFVVWLRVENNAQEIRQNRGILNRVRVSWAPRAEPCIENDGRHFEQLYTFTHNYSLFTLLFSE